MKFKPHAYQRYCIDYIKTHPISALFLDMGLGKTVTTLTALRDLMLDDMSVSKVLVIAPLRVARDTWPGEVEKWDHLHDLDVSVMIGTVKERTAALNHRAMIYVINRENIPNKMLQRINNKKSSVFGNMSLNIVLCAGNCNYSGSGSVRFALMDITPWVNREKYIYNFIDPATGVSQGIRIPSENTMYREFYPHQYFWENCSGNNMFYIVATEGEIQEDEAYTTPWASDLCIGFGSDVFSYNPFYQSGKQPYQALAANYLVVDVPDPNA